MKKEKVLVISASNNKKGNSALAAQWFIDGANSERYEFEWVYLYDLRIDPFTNENRKALVEQQPENKDIRALIEKIEAVEKVVVTTPIWNFSVPGPLKNMIDRVMCSGRVWSEEKQAKIPGWKGKKFYLMFTMGGPWYALGLNRYAVGQLFWVFRYFGASSKVVTIIPGCGNGSRCVIDHRSSLEKKLNKKGRRVFK